MLLRAPHALLIALCGVACAPAPHFREPPSGAVIPPSDEKGARPDGGTSVVGSAPTPPQPPPERVGTAEPGPAAAAPAKEDTGPVPLDEDEEAELKKKCKPLTRVLDARKPRKGQSRLDRFHEIMKKPPRMKKDDRERCTELLERSLGVEAAANASD